MNMQYWCQCHCLGSVFVPHPEVSGVGGRARLFARLLVGHWRLKWRCLHCAKPTNDTLVTVPTDTEGQKMSRAINVEAAVWITQLSKRTLWRRLSEGQITRQANDDEGRAMLTFEDLAPMLCIPVAPQDHDLIIEAAAGDAEAQNDLALLFLDADKPDIGLHWLALAADQGHSDAMHNLSKFYIQGSGTPKNDSLGLMWLGKAAALGHVIAAEQVTALTRIRKV